MVLFLAFIALFVGTLAFAVLFGDWPERWGAAIFAAAWLLTQIGMAGFDADNTQANPYVAIVDLMLLVALVVLALRCDRYWPMWAASFQIPSLIVTTLTLIGANSDMRVYMNGTAVWAWLQMIALALATWRYRRTKVKATSIIL